MRVSYGEDDAVREDIGDRGLYLEGKRTFPLILERKYERKKEKERQEKV